MVLKESALQKRAKKLESKGLLKINFNMSCLSALEELLHNIYVVGRPKPNDYHTRGDLIRVFNALAKEVYGGGKNIPVVEAFGSFSMDMFSNSSDLDLSVNFSNDVELSRDDKIKALRKLSKKLYGLQRKGHVFGVNPVMRARVPILKVVDRGTRIECDISIENKDGILKSQLVFIVSEIDERFQKLSSLMKAWAKAYGINSSKDRTLNSLSIILLVALHLQTRDPPILPPFSALLKDGTKPESVRKVVQDYLHFGKENKESIAELFAALLSKLVSVEALWPEGLCASAYEGSWISKTWNHKVGNISVIYSKSELLEECIFLSHHFLSGIEQLSTEPHEYSQVEDFMDRSQNVARAVCSGGVKTIYKCIHSSLHHLSSFHEGKIQAPKLKELLFGSEPIPRNGNTKNLKRGFPFDDTASPAPLASAIQKKARAADGWNSWGNGNHSLSATFFLEKPRVISGFRQASIGFGEELVSTQLPSPSPESVDLQDPPLPPPEYVGLQHPHFAPGYVGLPHPPLPPRQDAGLPHPHLRPEYVGFQHPPLHPLHHPHIPPPEHVGLQNPLGFDGSWHAPPGPMFPRPNGAGQWDSWSIHNQFPRHDVPFFPRGHGWAP